jgi:hypothetical protein
MLTGLMFGFKFFETVDVQWHDTYVTSEKRIDPISDQFYFLVTKCLVLTALFLAGELLLFKKVIRLNKAK